MLATVVLFSACNDDKKNDEPDPNPSTPVTAVKTVTDILELYGEEQKTVVDAMAAFGKGLSSSGDLLFVGNNIKMYDAACMIDYRFNTKSICIQTVCRTRRSGISGSCRQIRRTDLYEQRRSRLLLAFRRQQQNPLLVLGRDADRQSRDPIIKQEQYQF